MSYLRKILFVFLFLSSIPVAANNRYCHCELSPRSEAIYGQVFCTIPAMRLLHSQSLIRNDSTVVSSKTQNELSKQFSYAVQLYESENYFDAVTELKRLLFFDVSKEYLFSANLLIGKAYKAGAKLNEAVYHFTIAEINSRTSNEYYDAKIEIIRANILRRTTSQAFRLLDELANDSLYADKNKINYWRGWAYIFENNFDKAFDAFIPAGEHELALLCQNTGEKLYSEKFAKISSIFIPGAGQIYTGNYVNGIMSLGWNILAGYLTINSFVEDRIFDGVITGNLLWLRFYLGNIQNAEQFAKEKNVEIINNVMYYLQNDYKGLKP